jgi:hypothetical protein
MVEKWQITGKYRKKVRRIMKRYGKFVKYRRK